MHGQPGTMKREAPQGVFLGGFFMASSGGAEGALPIGIAPQCFPVLPKPPARSLVRSTSDTWRSGATKRENTT